VLVEHRQSPVPFGVSGRRLYQEIHDETVPVLHQDVAAVAEFRLVVVALPVELRFRIGRGLVGVGAAGSAFTLLATAGTTFTSSITIAVTQPSGTSLVSGNVARASSAKIDLGRLPSTGTYTLKISPAIIDSGSVDLLLIPEKTETLTVGAPPVSVQLAAAQHGAFTFSGAAGELRNLALSSLLVTPTGIFLSVLKPDGGTLTSRTASSSTTWQLPQLPLAGTYTIKVKPPMTSAASFGLQVTAR